MCGKADCIPALATGEPVEASSDANVQPTLVRKVPPSSASAAVGGPPAVPGSPETVSAEASLAATGSSGVETGSGVAPFTRSTTGCSTGSSTGNASASGGATVSIKPAAASSAAAATGVETALTVPAGTTSFTTGRAATNWSDASARLPARGCRRPGEGAAGGAGAVSLERDETEEVTTPSREPASVEESAVAAEVDNVIQVRVAAPARSNGRRTRQGDRALAMRTTPNAVETAGFYSVGLCRAARLGRNDV
jgi:hypothetical protein